MGSQQLLCPKAKWWSVVWVVVEIPIAIAGWDDRWPLNTIMTGGCKVESTIWGVVW
jgi:hypothetical protein